MDEVTKRSETLAALGLAKPPEFVAIRGRVAPGVAAALEGLSQESGLKTEEVVGLAVTDWVRRAERRLQATTTQPRTPGTDAR